MESSLHTELVDEREQGIQTLLNELAEIIAERNTAAQNHTLSGPRELRQWVNAANARMSKLGVRIENLIERPIFEGTSFVSVPVDRDGSGVLDFTVVFEDKNGVAQFDILGEPPLKKL